MNIYKKIIFTLRRNVSIKQEDGSYKYCSNNAKGLCLFIYLILVVIVNPILEAKELQEFQDISSVLIFIASVFIYWSINSNATFVSQEENNEGYEEAEQGSKPAKDEILKLKNNSIEELNTVYEKAKCGDKSSLNFLILLAEQSNAVAQYNLGSMYYKGEGIPKDYKEALKWFKLSAGQENPDAQYNLGVMYDEGVGIPKDLVLAYKWFNLASAQGHETAREKLELISKEMTASQIADAQKLSRNPSKSEELKRNLKNLFGL